MKRNIKTNGKVTALSNWLFSIHRFICTLKEIAILIYFQINKWKMMNMKNVNTDIKTENH